MENKIDQNQKESNIQNSIHTAIRIGFIALLFVMSYLILKPFIAPVVWGIIIAVALFPLHKRFAKILGNREKLSAILIVLIAIAVLVIPIIMFTSSTVESMQSISQQMDDGTLSVPPPNEKVADWPLIGKQVYDTWKLASNSLTETIKKFEPQIREFAPNILSAVTGLGGSILLFVISLIISGVILGNSESAEKAAKSVFRTLAGTEGEKFASLAGATIQSVVQGVLGTAAIQTVFLSIGMYAIDLPAAGIVSIILLIVAIIQLPTILVMLPVIIYVFSYANTTLAIIFVIWTILWSVADNFIKPMLMGRGVDIPMLVILLGAIGGMMMGGIIGLFVGAVFLAFTYKVLQAIMKGNQEGRFGIEE